MADEPVDRRGLFRELLKQATGAIAPALGVDLDAPPRPAEPHTRAGLAHRTVSIEELLSRAPEFGLEGRSEALSELARLSLRMVPSAHTAPVGLEFGGRPLMAEGQEWPSWQDRPLTFLGQVEAGEPLGRLLFFYDVTGRPSGCLAAHRGSARVLRANERRLAPAEGPAQPATAVAGQLAGELVMPRASSGRVESLELSEDERDAWESLRGELASLQGTEPADRPAGVFRVVHRVFGYPDETGGEMPLTCELASAGEDVIEGRAHFHPQAAKLERRSSRWELLAQLSGDGKLGWPWVAQRLYFWVDGEALAAGDLEQVWAISR
jgi:Domain of unknown function (DUF1963)